MTFYPGNDGIDMRKNIKDLYDATQGDSLMRPIVIKNVPKRTIPAKPTPVATKNLKK